MSTKILVMAGLAVAFGATSYFAGNKWLDSQTQARLSELESRQPGQTVEMSTVVVAAASLRFGEKITADKLKEVAWPKDALPAGAFSKIVELTGSGDRKAIKSMEPGEPVLVVKLTGANGRAGLAGIIAEGMRAVTIPVDMVNGVGGFVMPGDRVDIVLTRRDREEGDQTAKILMENVKVLSIDQQADSRADQPIVAKSVTLEIDAEGAQKLALATSLGRLSLLLRGAGDEEAAGVGGLSGQDLDGKAKKAGADDAGIFSFLKQEKKFATVKVIRGEEEKSHTVPVAAELNGEEQQKKPAN